MPAHIVSSEDVRTAALRPILGGGLRFWVIAGMLTALVIPGVVAYVTQLRSGLGVTGLSDDVFWGVYTANLVAFIGISYGGAVVSAVLRLTDAHWRAPITRMAEAMALISLMIGASFAVIHVGRPTRLWEMATSPNFSSPLVWDMIAISTYLAATAVLLYLPLIPDLAIARERLGSRAGGWRLAIYRLLSARWRGLPRQRRLLNWGMDGVALLIIPLAVAVHSVLAWAFGLTSRAGWHSSVLGPYFVVAALLSGVATVILVIAAFRKAYHLEQFIEERHFRYLASLMLALGVAYLYLTIAELLTEGYVLNEESAPALEALLLDRFAPLFWLFVVVGGAIPTLLVSLPWTRTIPGIVIAATLAVAGMWLKRILIVVPPLSQHVFEAESVAYRPSMVEALVTLSAAAAIPLLLMLFFRVFPVLSISEMEDVAEESDRAAFAAATNPGS
jgi:Ni/Fe-hydrogenase subunit HybB-like protein